MDVVSICSLNYLHHEIALEAVKAGKPFWIEKPMGVSAAQSKDIATAAEAAGLVTSVGFNYRHTPAIEKARQLIRSGRLGRGHQRAVLAPRRLRLLPGRTADLALRPGPCGGRRGGRPDEPWR